MSTQVLVYPAVEIETEVSCLKARLNGFNIWVTFVQQKLNGCWANVEQMLNGVLKRLQLHSIFSRAREMLNRC